MGDMPAVRYGPGERGAMLAFSLLGTAFDGADFAIFILFLAPLAGYFHASLLHVELIQASSYVAGIGGALLFGRLADRRGRRWGLSATVALYSLATLGSAFSPDYGVLFALRLVAGVGIGGEAGIAIACLNEVWRPARRGIASALLQGMFLVGSALAALLFGVLAPRFGPAAWRWGFGLLGAAALLAAAIRVWMPESRVWRMRRDLPDGGPAPGLWATLASGGLGTDLLRLAALMTCIAFGAYAVETYAPAAWLSVYHVAPAAVSRLVFLGLGTIFVAYVAVGAASDLWGRRPAAVASALLGGAGFVLYGTLLAAGRDLGTRPGNLPPLTLAAFLWMLCAAAPFGVAGAWMAEIYPTEVRAMGVNVAYYLGRGIGGGLGPLAALALAQHLGGDVRAAMASGLLGSLGTAWFASRIAETRARPLVLATGGRSAVVVE